MVQGGLGLRECLASHFMGEPGEKGIIILKVDITAAGREIVENTKRFYKVLWMVYY
jgi:hypothetical protein